MIVVTHEMMFAREAADRVVFMDGGVIVEQGPPDEVIGNPRSDRLRAFLRRFTMRGESSVVSRQSSVANQEPIADS
jgi:polar amino acid transport system ATP-binding protein